MACLVVLPPAAAWAQGSTYDISGYVKYLSSVSDYPQVEGRLWDQLLHARIQSSWYPSDSVRGEMDIRVRAFYGDSVRKIPHFIDQVKTEYPLGDLDAKWQGSQALGYAQIDRLWLDYTRGSVEVTVGRQRIAWGTALVWNVIDLYNPKSVLDFDYEEKPGADALRLQYYTGPVSKLELAASPGRTLKAGTFSGLYSVNAHGYDFYAIAGIRNNRWVAGGAWAGSILKGGFRGEFLVSQAPDRQETREGVPVAGSGSGFFASGNPVVSAVVSLDYTFSNTFYIHTECLFNSNGKVENAGAFQQEAQAAGMLSPARWSLYQEVAYDVTPLTRATLYVIYNPSDHSAILVPMVTRSITSNLDLLVIGQFASGKANSEFDAYGKSVTLRLKYSF
jgi:hypothetical protein